MKLKPIGDKIAAHTSNMFLAEAVWRGSDQSSRFISEGIWQPRNLENIASEWEKVKERDFLILKHENATRQMTIHAIGIVRRREKGALNVKWEKFRAIVGVSGDGVFKQPLVLLSNNYISEIFSQLEKSPNYADLENLIDFHTSEYLSNDLLYDSDYSEVFGIVLGDLKKNRSFFVAGHNWSGEDQLPRFVTEGIWENGHESRFERGVNLAKRDDVIFAKSTWTRDGTGMLTLRAVGVLMENLRDGNSLQVNWYQFPDKVDLTVGNQYRGTFHQIRSAYLDDILIGVLERYANLPNIIEDLSKGFKTELSVGHVRKLIEQHYNRAEYFWWYNHNSPVITKEPIYLQLNVKAQEHPFAANQLLLGFNEARQLESILKIIEITHSNSGIDEVVRDMSIRVIYSFNKPVSFKKLDEFAAGHKLKSFDQGIHQVSPELFELIINATELNIEEGTIKSKNQSLSKSGYNSDWAYTEKDLLGIENDVRAFALLLASRNVTPPLAIALFGRWGSGKSFFMRHLEKRIKELSQHQRFLNKDELPSTPNFKSREKEFCQGIAHIWFNAWSYLDANLWAGLAHSLFQKLNEYISNTTSGEIERLKIQVRIAKRLQLLHGDLQNYTEKKASLEELKKKLEREKTKRIANFFSSKYDKKILDFCKENGLPESAAKQLTPEALKEKIEVGTNLFKYFKRNIWQLIVVVTVVIAFFFAEDLLSSLIDSWKPFLESAYTKIVTVVAPILVPIISFYRKRAGVVKELLNNISELASKEKSNDKELEQLKKDIKEIDPIIQEIEESIHREYSLNPDITQLAIANFISSKSDQKEYVDRLGIVSVIRKDFETLSDLFYTEDGKDQEKAADEADTENKSEKQLREDRAYISEQFNKGQKLERIILYIDDLDRCSDAKVLEVVQAVHLLMAFPLFNVVVGVDKRCLHNALNYQYMLRYSEYSDTEGFVERIKEVKPEEYIEKIFQIPFQLKDASNDSIKTFIDDLLKDQIATDSVDVVPPSSLSAEKTSTKKVEKAKEEVKSVLASKVDDTPHGKKQTEILSDEVNSKIVTPRDLQLTKDELDLLKEIAWLLGKSPRTIKRFINIYRLIRAHEHLSYDDENKHDDFLSVMFFLALNIGVCREYAEVICETLKVDRDLLLSDAFDQVPKLKKVKDQIFKNRALKKLLDFKGERLLTYSEFVHRFSFSRVNEINELEAITD
ncbi:MAG: P-loop NTPase fold protein [Marinoscillum sp.]